jgi:hypothetical protein
MVPVQDYRAGLEKRAQHSLSKLIIEVEICHPVSGIDDRIETVRKLRMIP